MIETGIIAWIFILLYALASGIGTAIQKYGLMSIEHFQIADFIRNPIKTFKILFNSRYWLLGNAMTFTGIFLLLEIFSRVDLSVAAPLLNFNIIIVLLIGVLSFKETLKANEYVGAALLFSGLLPITLGATKKNYSYNLTIFFVFLLLLTIVGVFLAVLPKIKVTSGIQKSLEIVYSSASGTFFGLSAVLINMTVVSGLGVSLDLTNLSQWVNLINVYFFLFAIYNSLAYLAFQAALSNGRASIVFMLVNGISLVIPVIGGALIFNEALLIYPYYRLLGIILILLGIIIINYK